jgi:hypothetical protein
MAVFSAPQAYIKIDNQIAGFVRNIQATENVQRANVQGLGNLTLQEVPAVGYQCNFTVDQFFLSFKLPVVEGMIHRLGSVKAILDTLVLGELGFAIAIYRKMISSKDETTGLVTATDPTGETICQLNPCFVNGQTFSLAEGGVAGYNVNGIYLNPISTVNL